MIVAGIDEAGYGPMLGPLVVSVSLFRVPANRDRSALGASAFDLWDALAPVVSRKPGDRRIPVNDSKKLFQQKRSLVHLEEGLLPFLHVRKGGIPRSFRALLHEVARRGSERASGYLDRYPWYAERDLELPRDTFSGLIRRLANDLGERLAAAHVEFLGFASAPVEVLEFNERLELSGNKSAVSFSAIAGFLRRIWTQFAGEDVTCVIDRQGGRTHYSRQLFDAVRPRGVQIEVQSPEHSLYRLSRRGANDTVFIVEFRTESEEKHLPVALASMLSKYIRELHMAAFNQYFSEHDKSLRPTAGYVTDARRFLDDTRALRERLRIDEALLVRRR